MAASGRFGLLLLLCFVLAALENGTARKLSRKPCEAIECPAFSVLYQAQDFHIRLYNGSMWMSTATLEDISFYQATRTGFLQLFQYIQGKNKPGSTVPMTAPVLTGILPSDGPFCKSSFYVSFYIPTAFQKEPPLPEEDLKLHVNAWGSRYFAVREFGGFATDSNIAEEAAKLEASIANTPWAGMVSTKSEESYLIAQYNSPFEFSGRLNEVLLPIYPHSSAS